MIERLKRVYVDLGMSSQGSSESKPLAELREIIEGLEAKKPRQYDRCGITMVMPGEMPMAVSLTDVVVHVDDTGYFAISGVKAK